jgi:fused signal recognition particle receptor
MIAGVNGSGKTTSIGKLAKHFQAQGKSVLLAAGDTFRAAAREQLADLGRAQRRDGGRAGIGRPGRRGVRRHQCGRRASIDVVLADTAGRLPTQLHLMEEIAKVKRVIAKADPTAPHEVLLVLDANIGQNALPRSRPSTPRSASPAWSSPSSTARPRAACIAAIARQQPAGPAHCATSASARASTTCSLSGARVRRRAVRKGMISFDQVSKRYPRRHRRPDGN